MVNYIELKKKYPNKVPIIVNKAKDCNLNNLEKNKFLVFESMTLGEFQLIIRGYLKLKPSESLILFVNKLLIPNSTVLKKIQDEQFKDDIIIIEYCSENTFG